MQRIELVSIEGTLICVTGLRIGGSQDELQIGGTDMPMIKHPVTAEPYIPGSSLKGKMRGELEKERDRSGDRNPNEPCSCDRDQCPVCRVFGKHKTPSANLGPTRLIVRDCPLLSGGKIELKTENVMNRLTGAAETPRTQERVAAGSKFKVGICVQVLDMDKDFEYCRKKGKEALLEVVRHALRLVEATGLGAGVSRGSGQVMFDLTLNGEAWPLS